MRDAVGLAASPSALVVVSGLAYPAGVLRSAALRCRRARMMAEAKRVAISARSVGVGTIVVVSSVFLAGGEPRRWGAGHGVVETVEASAVEAAASAFAGLGGRSVVLRLGWPYGEEDRLTRFVVGAGAKGWQVFDGPANVVVPTIAMSDAVSAVRAALEQPLSRLPAGVYSVSDGADVSQGELSAAIAAGYEQVLHPLYDSRWGNGPLFGGSRSANSAAFEAMTGWAPVVSDPKRFFYEMACARRRG